MNVHGMRKKLRQWKKSPCFWLIIVIVFPLAFGLFYRFIRSIIAIDSGDILSFYGVALGIYVSSLIYVDKIQREKKEEAASKVPKLYVSVNKKAHEIFDIHIVDLSKNGMSDVYLYDEKICETLGKDTVVEVTFNLPIDEDEKIKPQYNVTCDDNIIDNDGFPKYVQIGVCDDDGDLWVLSYDKLNKENNIIYYLGSCEVS